MLDDACDKVLGHFYEKPLRLVTAGRLIATAGFLAIIAGLAGHVAVAGSRAVQLGQSSEATPTLEGLYPGLWLWWIPESVVGALPYLLMIAAGAWLASRGRSIHRVYH